MPGTLYLVATPIGNLEDITLRALRILREADLVACEDTRQTRKLLDHYGIHKATVSYHEHNEAVRATELIEKLESGSSVALVSDAGTPLVSDPGYRLVSQAIAKGIRVEPAPGPSAALAALAASGLPTDEFHFGGFLPARSSQRKKALARFKDEAATLVFYEAPHRVMETLADIEEVLGPRAVVLARELTKVHEEFLRGTAAELRRARITLKGEFTLLVGKAERQAAEDAPPVPEAVEACVRAGMSRMDAMKAVARERGLSKRDVYREVEDAVHGAPGRYTDSTS
jgi:16S rRNA (cytidine1402-2'-O)-methyltransferase